MKPQWGDIIIAAGENRRLFFCHFERSENPHWFGKLHLVKKQ